jgi:hypothetical protein
MSKMHLPAFEWAKLHGGMAYQGVIESTSVNTVNFVEIL